MKTTKRICKFTALSTMILAVVAVPWLPGSARAADQMKPMKGAEHLMMLNHINTPAQAGELKPGDTIAMACAKCKSVVVERVTTEKGHIKLVTPGEKHLCPGCQSTVEVVGTGKGAHDAVKHVCKACGDDSAFCCATTPNAKPTKGMETGK